MEPRINKHTMYFWSKVAITANKDECWNWTGAVSKNGYGNLKVLGTTVSAHRHSLEVQFRKRLYPGEIVRHKCDNKLCVNPWHLELGTHKDNTNDMIKRGRSKLSHGDRKGENNGNAVLSNEDAKNIKRLISLGYSNKEISAEYPVTHWMISRIRLKQNWDS